MKKILFVCIVAVVAATAAFAGGYSEKAQAAPGAGNGRGPVLQGAAEGVRQDVTLTGTLVMKDGSLVLSVEDNLYSLGGPGTRMYADEFEEGDVIEVAGVLVSDCQGDCDRDLNGHIFLEKVTKDGEEYTFSAGAGNRGSRGRGRGQKNTAPSSRGGYGWSRA